jgi:hypothetical protein
MAIDLLSLLHHQADYSFCRIVTESEFWFPSSYLSDHIFAMTREEVSPREKALTAAQRVMLTILFSDMSLATANTLPSGA